MPTYEEDIDVEDTETECRNCGHVGEFNPTRGCPECGHSPRDPGLTNYSADVLSACAFNWQRASECGDKRMRMGIELEMTSRTVSPSSAVRDPLNRAFNLVRSEFPCAVTYCITKSDASISGPNPAELCTIPLTVSEHARVLYRAFPDGRIGGNSISMWNNSSCGMHIHTGVYRSNSPSAGRCITPLSVGKVMVFINDPLNEEFWVDMCGRSPNSYAKFRRAKVTDYYKHSRSRSSGSSSRSAPYQYQPFEKYDVLNISNGRTVEFRLPRPTVRIKSVLKNLELVESAFDWVKFSAASSAFTYQTYLRWLAHSDNRKTYTYLHSWLCKKQSRFGNLYRSFL